MIDTVNPNFSNRERSRSDAAMEPISSESKPLQGRMGWFRESDKILIVDESEPVVYFNVANILTHPKPEWRNIIENALRQFVNLANVRSIVINVSAQFINAPLLNDLTSGSGVELKEIDDLIDCVTIFASVSHKYTQQVFVLEPFPQYDIEKHRGVVRLGIVELRVVENFLRDPEKLKSALANVLSAIDDEKSMYADRRSRSWCAADDFEWNIRRLMTNAGFYTSRDAGLAWLSLEDWASRYVIAMRRNYLASQHNTYLFSFATQKILWDKFRTRINYIRNPEGFSMYEQIKGKRILFVSPLAHLVNEQYKSGNIWNLYKARAVPRFELSATSAWISTWPNRPHSDWSETFAHLCKQVDEMIQRQSFDVFIASCGCYGLPLVDYVRETYNISSLYLGNISNFYFGVLQGATFDYMKNYRNTDAFVQSDLGKFPNVNLIDSGRYV